MCLHVQGMYIESTLCYLFVPFCWRLSSDLWLDLKPPYPAVQGSEEGNLKPSSHRSLDRWLSQVGRRTSRHGAHGACHRTNESSLSNSPSLMTFEPSWGQRSQYDKHALVGLSRDCPFHHLSGSLTCDNKLIGHHGAFCPSSRFVLFLLVLNFMRMETRKWFWSCREATGLQPSEIRIPQYGYRSR